MLAPLDLLVLLKLCAKADDGPWGQVQVATELFISQSSVHAALKRAEAVRLYSSSRRRVSAPALEEALVHGAKYFLGPKRGGVTRGVPTSWAAPPLVHELVASDELPPVWPDSEGTVRGITFEPLYPSVPRAAKLDSVLRELLTLVDALRDGGARVSKLAARELHARLHRS